MNDQKIFKISLIVMVVGLLGIITLSVYVNPEKLTINKLEKSKIDNQVEIEATITSITQTKSKTLIIKITDNTGSTTLVIFPQTEIKELRVHDKIRVIGKVTQYKGDLELILEESKNLEIL